MARSAAARADLVLFVTDSDLNETEHAALLDLASVHKPLILVLNKADLYRPEEIERLVHQLTGPRLAGVIAPENVVTTSADPRPVEYVIESPTGGTRSEWRSPPPDVGRLNERIVELLSAEGQGAGGAERRDVRRRQERPHGRPPRAAPRRQGRRHRLGLSR